MTHSKANTGNDPQKRTLVLALGIAAIAVGSAVVVSCFHDDDGSTVVATSDAPLPDDPANISPAGTRLYCDTAAMGELATVTTNLAVVEPDSIPRHNVSFQVETGDEDNSGSWNNHNAGNRLKSLVAVAPAQKPNGDPVLDDTNEPFDVHPLIVSYGEQVRGGYEGGDGSADIPDPDNIDDIFVSMSLDNGTSWKKYQVGDTAFKFSKTVSWNGVPTEYPGHSHKPTMAVDGNNILVAWNDKYCPSGDPFDLFDTEGNLIDPEQTDYYKVNGSQGTVDYEGVVFEPNGKAIYETPYSCVWTARGVFGDPEADGTYEIEWRQAQQLTSGTRDSNKIWIAAEDVGFAITWQEDPDGLRPGKGEGPGDGWSGATTNHGSDIWYTYIPMVDFADVCTDAECTASTEDPLVIAGLDQKPKAAVNFAYPVRITNNDTCTPDDTKEYCADHCGSTTSVESNNQSSTSILRCVQDDYDYMVPDSTVAPQDAILDGDTGASRPAATILKTDKEEYITVLVYEETKGLSESSPADQGDTETDIALEGKAVYFESFFWDQPVEVSAGRIVNTFVEEATVADDGTVTLTGDKIYENARRVVIMNQVDACEMDGDDPTFALMYKQGYDTQGGPSDMFVRVNYGFTYDDFGLLDGREVTNVSAHDNVVEAESNRATAMIWDSSYLDKQSYDNPEDNTFSPRGWLRGGDLITGFEYSNLWRATSVGTVPNNFMINRYVDSTWYGPVQITLVTNPEGAKVSTLDPRFIPTPAGGTALPTDASNPDVIFMAYGTFDMTTGVELDLHYSRSADRGATWEYIDGSTNEVVIVDAGADRIPGTTDDIPAGATRQAKLAGKADIHEMEVQGIASPDGTVFMGAWLEEIDEGVPFTTPTLEVPSPALMGLESAFGRVEYEAEEVVLP